MSSFLYCKDCREVFEFTEEERVFFNERKWALPVRCKPCREKKRTSFEMYGNICELMNNNDKKKRRRTRVYYAPHIVGGFR